MKIQISNPSGNAVAPNNSSPLTQQWKILNSMYGQQPAAVKVRMDFVVNGRQISQDFVATFPPPI